MVQQDLAHGLVERVHDRTVILAGDEEEGVRGDGGHHLGALALEDAVHIAVDAAFGQGLGHLVAFLEEERLEGKPFWAAKRFITSYWRESVKKPMRMPLKASRSM